MSLTKSTQCLALQKRQQDASIPDRAGAAPPRNSRGPGPNHRQQLLAASGMRPAYSCGSTRPTLLAFLYPRPRPMIRDSSHSSSYRLSTPSLAQYCPCTTDRWIRSCITTLSHQNISKSLRTMKDPVQRTASPYTDPSVKGPRSQQLFSHTHSLLHNHKSELFLNSVVTFRQRRTC